MSHQKLRKWAEGRETWTARSGRGEEYKLNFQGLIVCHAYTISVHLVPGFSTSQASGVILSEPFIHIELLKFASCSCMVV